MIEIWNERYANKEFAYGIAPNVFLKNKLEGLPIGTILFPAEGEGRNAVYAATLGWTVFAFDQSIEGKNKAMQLANMKHAEINYEVGAFEKISYLNNQFDVIALIYAHFPAALKSSYHKVLKTYLKPNGIIIFEAFSKNHLAYNSKNQKVGGPKDIDMLFSIEEIKNDFDDFEVIELVEKEIELKEGIYHNGLGSVIRFVGRKK